MAAIRAPHDKAETPSSGLQRGLRERGFSIGVGEKLPFHRFAGRTKVQQVQSVSRWGRFRNSRQEWLWEVPVTVFVKPGKGVAAGVNIVFRQHLGRGRKFQPFFEFGPGVLLTNYDVREISGPFQFSLQSGIGLRARLGSSSHLIVSIRWYHISNLGLKAPNVGLNQSLVSIGYSRFYYQAENIT